MSTLDALILAAVELDLVADSHSLAKAFGIGHALVLRAVSSLGDGRALLNITARDARTQRCFLTLAPGGEALVASVKALNWAQRCTFGGTSDVQAPAPVPIFSAAAALLFSSAGSCAFSASGCGIEMML